jgi:hypothetical protein
MSKRAAGDRSHRRCGPADLRRATPRAPHRRRPFQRISRHPLRAHAPQPTQNPATPSSTTHHTQPAAAHAPPLRRTALLLYLSSSLPTDPSNHHLYPLCSPPLHTPTRPSTNSFLCRDRIVIEDRVWTRDPHRTPHLSPRPDAPCRPRAIFYRSTRRLMKRASGAPHESSASLRSCHLFFVAQDSPGGRAASRPWVGSMRSDRLPGDLSANSGAAMAIPTSSARRDGARG